MIQRIQTIFLLISLFLVGLMFNLKFAEILTNSEIYIFNFNEIKLIAEKEVIYLSTLPIIILIVIIELLLLLTVLLYKKRMLQIRLCIVNIVLSLGLSGLIFYYVKFVSKQLNAEYQLNIAIVLPVITAIFLFLALRYIAKDEALVRSVDRLRK